MPDTEPGTEVAAVPPTPTFVPTDDFKQYQATMQTALERLTESIGMMAQQVGRGPAPVAVPTAARITREQYAEALREGNVDVLEAWQAQREADLLARHVAPLASTGTAALSALNRERLAGKPHYARFRKEVDAALAEVPAEHQANPALVDKVYAMVVGEHAGVLEAEAREAAIRQATQPPAEPATPAPSAGRTAGKTGAGTLPTPEELLGAEAGEALRSKLSDPSSRYSDVDGWARSMGYRGGWSEYVELVRGQGEG